jgi:hypothetical protein
MLRKLWMVSMTSRAPAPGGRGRSLVRRRECSVQERIFLVDMWMKSIAHDGVGLSRREGRRVCGWVRGGAVRWHVGQANMSLSRRVVMDAQSKYWKKKSLVEAW